MRFKREISAAFALAAVLCAVGLVAPAFFSLTNLRDLALVNAPLLIVAVGATVVILSGEIDVSVGSQFAVASVVAGLAAKYGAPTATLAPIVVAFGGLVGAVNGYFVARWRLPSIIVTLAMLVALRDGLRWTTEGAWVQDLPASFQWLGLGQAAGQLVIVVVSLGIFGCVAWGLRNLAFGRAVYAVGSNAEAARLAGIEPQRIVFAAFVFNGMLTALAALLNAVRFSVVPSNAGIGMELQAIAAVVVGGTAITGGRGRLVGTLVGVSLLGIIGPALTFVGINPYWEKAIQGAVILAALASDRLFGRFEHHVVLRRAHTTSR